MEQKQPEPKTMFEKIWEAHAVREVPGESTILYIDRHLVHEATSSRAFAGLRVAGRLVRRPDSNSAVLDHNVPSVPGRLMLDAVDQDSVDSLTAMDGNAGEFDLTHSDMAVALQVREH